MLLGENQPHALYYFYIYKIPEDSVYVSVTPWSKGSERVHVQANLATGAARITHKELRAAVPSDGKISYTSADFHNTAHLRISASKLKEEGCETKICALVLKVAGDLEFLNFDILATSETVILHEDK